MKNLHIQFAINPGLFLKDPNSSSLGKRIVSTSIEMIHDLGFEDFTFKKLGEAIGSPESSIYRYFESKHTLLVYLYSWYWCWIEYQLVFATGSLDSPREKLEVAVKILTQTVKQDTSFSHVNEVLLSEIIMAESVKALHTKAVDTENTKGYFAVYKQVVRRVSNIVLELNPGYAYPNMLISTLIEGAQQQRYFAEHLPALTDINKKEDNIYKFYKQLVFHEVIDEDVNN